MRSYPPQYQRSSTPLIRLLPYLSRKARRYFAIPATSALVKCLFLVAGQVVTAKGASLESHTVPLLVFVHHIESVLSDLDLINGQIGVPQLSSRQRM